MIRTLLHNLELLDPEAAAPAPGWLLIEDGRIARVEPGALAPDESALADAARIDLDGRCLAPGFLDLHFHGELIFAAAEDLDDALRRTALRRVRHGVTGFLATTISGSVAASGDFVTRVASAMTQPPAPSAARCLGVHLEGPWINVRHAGAQPPGKMRDFDSIEATDLLARGAGAVRMVTLAPELEQGLAAVEALHDAGVVVALGHSAADAQRIDAAVTHGMTHVTHLFNAMTQAHHRQLGVAGCALTDARLSCDLICDGVHVHPRMVALAARAKPGQLSLITDRIEPPASGSGSGDFGAGELRSDGVALRLPDGRLAGSALELDRAVSNFRRFSGASLLESVAAATLRPARVLGLEAECGSLRPGARADFAVLDSAGGVEQTWIAGRRAYERSESPAEA